MTEGPIQGPNKSPMQSKIDSRQAYQDAHKASDTDYEPYSIHHTIGKGPRQAAAGNHDHDDLSASITDLEALTTALEAMILAFVPSGTLFPYAGDTAPSEFLICDGSAISRTTYADLFAVIGTDYGAGDGSTTFNIPNLKGRTIVGLDSGQTEFDALGETGGAKTVTLTEAQMPSHNHTITTWGHVNAAGTSGGAFVRHTATGADITYNINSTSKGSDQPHNNLQPYITLNYLIKI